MSPRATIWMLLAATACTNAQPCSTCPPIEGVWFLQYVAPVFPCDAGTPLPTPPNALQLQREGSVLRSVLDGIELTGTLYDTYDFTLNGQALGGGETVSMRALYRPASNPDAGDEQLLEGRLTRDTEACSEQRTFTGARF
jgi:hypothetical protein